MSTLQPPALIPAPPASRRQQTFRALRHRNYRLWFYAQSFSLIGTWMQSVAQQILVYRLTNSAMALGLVSFISLIPVIPFSLWGGSLADRFPKRNVLMFTQSAMALQSLILGVLTWTGRVEMWHVYALSLLLGVTMAVDIPVRQSFTVELVEGKEDLANGIALNSASFNTARALGPALAGVTVAATGEGIAFLLNALSFLPLLFVLPRMRNLPAPIGAANGRGMAHVAEGVRFVLTQRVLLVLISLVAVSALLSMPFNTVLPVFVDERLTTSSASFVNWLCHRPGALMQCQTPEALPLGALLAAVGVGAVIGALLVASIGPDTRKGRMLTLGNIAFPIVLLALAVTQSFLLALFLLLLVGVSFVWQNALANTLLQTMSPDHLRGRIMSVYTLTFQTTMRLGSLQAGALAEWWGAAASLGIGAIVALAYNLWVAVRYPSVRNLQ